MTEKEIIEKCDILFICLGDVMSKEVADKYREAYKEFKKLYQKEKEKNKELENKIDRALQELDTGEYTAYTFYGDTLFRDNDLINILKNGKPEYELEEE